MKRLLAALFCTTMLVALFGAASAVQAEPGPNGSNEKGLCTAYFNGQKKGHDKQKERNGEAPGPFAGLEEHAEGESDDDETVDAVYEYCEGMIGGNMEHGRYTCTVDETPDDSSDGDYDCTENGSPGGGNGGGNPNA